MSIIDIFHDNEQRIRRYLDDWNLAESFGTMQEAANERNISKLAWAAHHAWVKLPDHRKIRYGGFFPLADIAAAIFDPPAAGEPAA